MSTPYKQNGMWYRLRDAKIMRLYREFKRYTDVAAIMNMSADQVRTIVKYCERQNVR